MFIYYTKGAIEKKQLQEISKMTEMSINLIKNKTNEIDNPDFLWILRDFDFEVPENDSNLYFDSQIKNYEQRKLNYFKRNECTFLPYRNNMDEVYINAVNKLRTLIFDSLLRKKFMNGTEFADFVMLISKQLNETNLINYADLMITFHNTAKENLKAIKSKFINQLKILEEQIAYQYIPPAGGFWTHFGYYRLYKRVQEIVHKLDTGPLLGGGADLYLPLRQCRQQIAPDHLVTAYPDIKNGLEAFRGNLNQIVDRSEAMGAHVILATQPSIWQKDMPPETAKLLLSGAIGFFSSWENCNDAHYYAPETLESALHQFNKVTMSVCRERSVTCVDLENLIPKSADYYFDDMHYTERGAHLVARYVADAVTDDNRVGHVTTKVGD